MGRHFSHTPLTLHAMDLSWTRLASGAVGWWERVEWEGLGARSYDVTQLVSIVPHPRLRLVSPIALPPHPWAAHLPLTGFSPCSIRCLILASFAFTRLYSTWLGSGTEDQPAGRTVWGKILHRQTGRAYVRGTEVPEQGWVAGPGAPDLLEAHTFQGTKHSRKHVLHTSTSTTFTAEAARPTQDHTPQCSSNHATN